MSSEENSEAPLLFLVILAALLVLQTGCAGFRGKQHNNFSTPTPLGKDQTLVLGFLGGIERWDDESRGVRQVAIKLEAMNLPRVHVETFENRERDLAIKFIQNALDYNQNGLLEDWERESSRLILYGHSLGGAAVVKVANDLKKMGVPVLLTVQIDSVGLLYDDHIIPSNVKHAANLFQNDGWILHGEDKIEPERPDRTRVIANIKFDYQDKNVDMSNSSWERRLFSIPHIKMEADPEVWATVEKMILSEVAESSTQIFAGDMSSDSPSPSNGKVTRYQQESGKADCLIVMHHAGGVEGCKNEGLQK
jgi:hypothetical protein